jgi:hypothetical protein
MNDGFWFSSVEILLAVGTLISAIIAASYWYKSSRIPFESGYTGKGASISDVPQSYIMNAQIDIFTTQDSLRQAAYLNARAAIWTALSAIFGAITTIGGLFSNDVHL